LYHYLEQAEIAGVGEMTAVRKMISLHENENKHGND
jgi:hypothetical protein